MIIALHDLQEVANKASKQVCEEYHKTVLLCMRQKDLPGIWPRFYLYSDLTWNIGYEATAELLASIDVKEFTSRELLDTLEVELTCNHHEINRLVPTASPKVDDEHKADPKVAHHRRTAKPRARPAPAAPRRRKLEKATW